MKKALLLDSPTSCRLSAFVLKTYEPREMSSLNFIRNVYLSKVKRWVVGWVETQDYLLRWAMDAIDGHPCLNRRRVGQVVLRNILNWHLFFLMPFNGLLIPIMGAPHYSFVALTVLHYILVYLLIGLVQSHLYESFHFLAFDWKTLPSLLIGSQILYPFLPCYMLWTFVKHSFLDRAVGHTSAAPRKELSGENKENVHAIDHQGNVRNLNQKLHVDKSRGGTINPLRPGALLEQQTTEFSL